ncbi:hypothetical protein Ahy_B09g100145 isoform B [Arachis hypogaea]|uniref:RNase H type-1 domain-containing protein n=1 Tax=Arachis hypogaea TaxID=3818 RepID=A0A444XVV1_ARAHY|nr:hypothetical protein Ahy_B09g100145 isoform B [Arachis hypogaea]
MILANNLGLQKMLIESDSLPLVQNLKSKSRVGDIDPILLDILQLAGEDNRFSDPTRRRELPRSKDREASAEPAAGAATDDVKSHKQRSIRPRKLRSRAETERAYRSEDDDDGGSSKSSSLAQRRPRSASSAL